MVSLDSWTALFYNSVCLTDRFLTFYNCHASMNVLVTVNGYSKFGVCVWGGGGGGKSNSVGPLLLL